jgi:predicted nucleic acid-binding protein
MQIHIHIAKDLGCEYLVSFDSDFKKAKDIIEEKNNIQS